ncbi:MAG: RNA pseudouridine synthase [Bacilli bacterium]|nr:RNA pseudouridine synthase [Bacilli bacterium]
MGKMKILYEDNHIIVVVKDYNIPVQEDSSKDTDLLTMIKSYLKEKYNKPGNVYLGLVHRLDRPVGGVMVFAKTSKAASRLSNLIREKKIEKRYMALVHNHVLEHEKLIDKLYKDENTNTSYVRDDGKESILEYNLIEYRNNFSLIDINLLTGRHHQIRVQLSHHGYPIYGDQKYGIDKEGIQIHLWAYKLKFKHPVKDEIMEFTYYPNFK